MRNLILFLTRNYYIILFLSLETLAVFFVIQNNHFQRSRFLNSSNVITGNIYEMYSGITDYFGLKYENQKLAEENILLRNQLRQSSADQNNSPLLVKDTLHKKQYRYISAKVVNNSTNRRKNYFTLNVGSKQGVKKEMGVMNSDGVVGIILDVSENFSSAMSVLHENAKIPVIIKKFGEHSVLSWNGTDEWHAKLEPIPSHLEIKKGDTIVTSSNSNYFPEGIRVGTVDEYTIIAGNTFYKVTVKLSTNFSRLSYVTVIDNLLKEEQTKLETVSQR